MKLETQRLVLRDFKESDLKVISVLLNNKEISSFMLNIPYPYSLKDSKAWYKKYKESIKLKPRDNYYFALIPIVEKKPVGGINLKRINYSQGTAELSYWIATSHQRRGLMSEALVAVLDFAFFKLKLRRVSAQVFTNNLKSSGLLTKFGFTLEGTLRKVAKSVVDGSIHDDHLYSMLKEEWEDYRKLQN